MTSWFNDYELYNTINDIINEDNTQKAVELLDTLAPSLKVKNIHPRLSLQTLDFIALCYEEKDTPDFIDKTIDYLKTKIKNYVDIREGIEVRWNRSKRKNIDDIQTEIDNEDSFYLRMQYNDGYWFQEFVIHRWMTQLLEDYKQTVTVNT